MKRIGLFVLASALGPLAHAGLINYSGSFAATDLGSGSAVTAISGSWSFVFDDSVVGGVGLEIFTPSLTTFTLNPNPLGATTFDTSNTGSALRLLDGVPFEIHVGFGLISVLAAADDFSVLHRVGLTSVLWSIATEPDIVAGGFTGSTGSFAATPVSEVPEPGTLTLFGAALVGIALLRRRGR